MAGTMNTSDVKFVYNADISGVLRANRVVTKDVDATLNSIGKSMARQAKFQSEMDYGLTKLSNNLKKVVTPFAGYAMSIMFAGMAIQKTFTQMWKFGTKAFQDINHSVEGTVTQSDMLEGSMKYLGYTIGAALEPVISWLIPIVETISDWIDKNPKLTATITTLGIAIGGAAGLYGMTVLAKNGFKDLFTEASRVTGLTGTQMLSIGFGLAYAGMGVDQIIKDEVLKGIGTLTQSAGFMAIAGGKTGVAAGLFALGFALQVTDVLVSGKPLTAQALGSMLAQLAPGLLFMSGPVGAAVLTMGIALTLLPQSFIDDLVYYAGIAFGSLFLIVAGIADAILSPIRTIINGMILIANAFGGHYEYIDPLSFTKDVLARMEEMTDMRNLKMNTTGGKAGTFDNPNDYFNTSTAPQNIFNIYVNKMEEQDFQDIVDAAARNGQSSMFPTR